MFSSFVNFTAGLKRFKPKKSELFSAAFLSDKVMF